MAPQTRPKPPPGQKHWGQSFQRTPDTPSRVPAKAKAKASRPNDGGMDMRKLLAEATFGGGDDSGSARYSRISKDDPLNLKEPPHGPDPHSQRIADGDYLGAGLNPDSLLADVEALLAQERMLAEQTRWWEERANAELKGRRKLKADLKSQEVAFAEEVATMQKEIANARNLASQEKERIEASKKQAADLVAEKEAKEAEAEKLSRRLEQIAATTGPQNAAQIRSSLASAASPSGSASPKVPKSRSNSAASVPARASPPMVPPITMGGASNRPSAMGGMGFDDMDFDDSAAMMGGGFGGGGGSNIGSVRGAGGGGPGLALGGGGGGGGGLDLGFDEDDDLDMDDLGFG